MKGFTNASGAKAALFAGTLLAALSILVANPAGADPRYRGSWSGDHHDRWQGHRGGASFSWRYAPSRGHWARDGRSSFGGERAYRYARPSFGGWAPATRYARPYANDCAPAPRYVRPYASGWAAAPRYDSRPYGGVPYDDCGRRVVVIDGYRRVAPRSTIRVGIGFDSRSERTPDDRYDTSPDGEPVDPPRVETGREPSVDERDTPSGRAFDPGSDVDVENLPPAGTYYYDRFCNQRFADLDSYTEHVESHGHAKTIEIVTEGSDARLRTLEFVDGYWEVQK